MVTLVLAASIAAMALATSSTPEVAASSNAKLGQKVVVDAHGRTLYYLSPETKHHLLCTSRECLSVWRPLRSSSDKSTLRAGPGVQGHLGIFRRHNGLVQVTLRGLLLYTFAGDRAKGQVNGQGIHSFGGTWHVVLAGTSALAPTSATETTSDTSTASRSASTSSSYTYTTTTTAPSYTYTTTTPTTTTTSSSYSYYY
jgi:predicted lipoprotein with Yx(FWY)xxD motif